MELRNSSLQHRCHPTTEAKYLRGSLRPQLLARWVKKWKPDVPTQDDGCTPEKIDSPAHRFHYADREPFRERNERKK